MDYSQIIGKNIAEFRKGRALTQEQLGDAVGVTGQAVSKWENGGMPDAYLLPDIAAAPRAGRSTSSTSPRQVFTPTTS